MSDGPYSGRVPRPAGLTPDHIVAVGPNETDAALVDAFGRPFRLCRRTRVGRDADSVDIAILDEAVSSVHAELTIGRDGWTLTDWGSTNGTFVEGNRLKGSQLLAGGQVIAFADVAFLFVEHLQ